MKLGLILYLGLAFGWKTNKEPDILGYNLYANRTNQIAFILHPTNRIDGLIVPPGLTFYSLSALNTNLIESDQTTNEVTTQILNIKANVILLETTNINNGWKTNKKELLTIIVTNYNERMKFYKTITELSVQ